MNAINNAINPAATNIHQLVSMRYAKFWIQAFITRNDTGVAITIAIQTSFINSLETSAIMFATVAPNTFRIPISLERCSAVNAAKLNKPRQEIIIAMKANTKIKKDACRSS